MRMFLLLAASSFISNYAFAQESASNVTDAQVAFYQLGIETGCKDTGHRKNDPAEKVESFCNCMMNTLKQDMTYSEWQQAYLFSRNHQYKKEMQIIGPHLSKVQACRS